MDFNQGFSPISPRRWRAGVETALAGVPLDEVETLPEGIVLRPLYLPTDWPARHDPGGFPGSGSRIRGSRPSGSGPEGWDIRIAETGPDAGQANRVILADLERGATSLLLCLAENPQEPGLVLTNLDDFDRLLADVHLALVPVALNLSENAMAAAAMLTALWQRRGIDPQEARGAFNIDPLAHLATRGYLSDGLAPALGRMSDIATWTAARHPQVTAVGVDSTPYHDAGATETEELAFAMASGLFYLKALTDAGMNIDQAASQIAFTMSIGCDQFLGIGKLRAARKLWARIAEASGASERCRGIRLHARTARREMCRRAHWVNLPRSTLAAFAAVLGGAESVTVLPADEALGGGGGAARRIARNLQVILKEEGHLDRVIDPAGGAWYVETLTEGLARSAWKLFQDIEGRGGILPALTSGRIAARVGASRQERLARIARRLDLVTAVSDYPQLGDLGAETPPLPGVPMPACPPFLAGDERPTGSSIETFGQAVAAAHAGTGLAAIHVAWRGNETPALAMSPLPRHRLAEAFEDLQDAAEAMLAREGQRPTILAIVPPESGTSAFLRDFLAAGGIAMETAATGNGVRACKQRGATVAILVDRPDCRPADLVRLAGRLTAAGATHLLLATEDTPRDIPGLRPVGVIHPGCDALALLRQIHELMGVTP